MDLINKTCTACKGTEPTLKIDEIKRYLKKISPDWKLIKVPDKIVRDFLFDNYNEAIEFVNKVAALAESEGHHPEICVHSYNKVKIDLWTHKIGGLHENDFIMAAKIERLIQPSK